MIFTRRIRVPLNCQFHSHKHDKDDLLRLVEEGC